MITILGKKGNRWFHCGDYYQDEKTGIKIPKKMVKDA